MKALTTAGHTDHHLSYLVSLAEGDGSSAPVVCTGGSILPGSTGRTDLLGVEKAEPLAHAQWRSVRRLLTTLPPDTRIYPTHGFGSFCSSTPSAGDVRRHRPLPRRVKRTRPRSWTKKSLWSPCWRTCPPCRPITGTWHRSTAGARWPRGWSRSPCWTAARLAEAVKDSEWVVDLKAPPPVRGRASARDPEPRARGQPGHLPRLARAL